MKCGWKTWMWGLVAVGTVAAARADLAYEPRRASPLVLLPPSLPEIWKWRACSIGMALAFLCACFLPSLGVFLVEMKMKRRARRWTKAILPLSAAVAVTLLSIPLFASLFGGMSGWAVLALMAVLCAVLAAAATLLARKIGWKRWLRVCLPLLVAGAVGEGVIVSLKTEPLLARTLEEIQRPCRPNIPPQKHPHWEDDFRGFADITGN